MTAGSDSKLLLYTAKVCPYAARAELALELAGLDYDVFEVDLMNKPSWYADKINAASKGEPWTPLAPTSPRFFSLTSLFCCDSKFPYWSRRATRSNSSCPNRS